MARTHYNVDFAELLPDPGQYDVIAYGVQECVRNEKRDQANAIKTYLGNDFVEICYEDMWEMLLVVFLKRKDLPFLSGVPITNYKTLGVMGLLGNKGGIWCIFELYGKLFSFINCHLTSGAGKADDRSEMMSTILRTVLPAKDLEKIEPDAFAHYNWIVGDMN